MSKKTTYEVVGLSPRLYQATNIPGWEILGTLKADAPNNYRVGALVRNLQTGLYALANGNKITSLDQAEASKLLPLTTKAVTEN